MIKVITKLNILHRTVIIILSSIMILLINDILVLIALAIAASAIAFIWRDEYYTPLYRGFSTFIVMYIVLSMVSNTILGVQLTSTLNYMAEIALKLLSIVNIHYIFMFAARVGFMDYRIKNAYLKKLILLIILYIRLLHTLLRIAKNLREVYEINLKYSTSKGTWKAKLYVDVLKAVTYNSTIKSLELAEIMCTRRLK